MKLSLLAVGGVVGALVVGAGCGGDEMPSNAAATVDSTAISTAAFDKRFLWAVKSEDANRPSDYDPPDFDGCIAAKRKVASGSSGKAETSQDALRKDCALDYKALRAQAMEFLIQQEWVRQEAADRGLKVTSAETQAELQREKDQVSMTAKQYRTLLRSTARTEEDVVQEISTALLQRKLLKRATAGKVTVVDGEVRAYYSKYKKELGKPERRSLRIVITKSRGKASEAKQALVSGQSWDSVAKEYSVENNTAKNGGRLSEVSSTGYSDIDAMLERAGTGKIYGPTKSRLGWWVFELEKVLPAMIPSLKDARAEIFRTLRDGKKRAILDEFAKDFREKYRSQTVCADDFKVSSCKNGPAKNATRPGHPTDATPTGIAG